MQFISDHAINLKYKKCIKLIVGDAASILILE